MPGIAEEGRDVLTCLLFIARDFWGYFEPIRQSMPANCSADVEAVIAHVDSVLTANVSADVTALKTTFGLQGLAHNDDFAAARAFPASLLYERTDRRANEPMFSAAAVVLVAEPAAGQRAGRDVLSVLRRARGQGRRQRARDGLGPRLRAASLGLVLDVDILQLKCVFLSQEPL